MEQSKFSALLPLLIGSLADRIMKETGASEDAVLTALYHSGLYLALEREETKVWTFSVPTLFEIYMTELTTGNLDFPDY